MTIEFSRPQVKAALKALHNLKQEKIEYYDGYHPGHDYRVFPEYRAITEAMDVLWKVINQAETAAPQEAKAK